MNQKVTFIASCAYSGSTILELLLTTHPECIGIGEAYQFADPRNPVVDRVEQYSCTCGATTERCDLWGPIIRDLRNHRKWHVDQKYANILQHVYNTYGTDSIVIDSSKRPDALEFLARIPNIELNVIHIIRDVRAYLISMIKNYHRNWHRLGGTVSHRYWMAGLRNAIKRNRLVIFQNWYRTNKQISRMVKRLNVRCLAINYEDLCLDTDPTVNRLSRFLELDIRPDLMFANGTHNHNMFGNRL